LTLGISAINNALCQQADFMPGPSGIGTLSLLTTVLPPLDAQSP
jgi:hypothetical protein